MHFIDYLLVFKFELSLILIIIFVLILSLFKKSDTSFNVYFNGILFLLFLSIFNYLLPVYNADSFKTFFLNLQSTDLQKSILHIGSFLIAFQSKQWIQKNNFFLEFFILLCCSILGLDFIISSEHFIILYVAIELSTLPLIALTNFDFNNKISTEASIKFLFSAGFSTAILLFGVSLLYLQNGSFQLVNLFKNIDTINPITIIGCLLFLSGIAFKLSAAPFHLYTADVFEGAPIPITNFLSIISKTSFIFLIIKILHNSILNNTTIFNNYLFFLIGLSIFIGNIFALQQKNLKRFLAFSSISQIGFILVGILSSHSLAITNCTFFIIIYLFSNLLAFGVIGVIKKDNEEVQLNHLNGLYYKNKFLSIALLIGLVSLAGIPPTAGFFGKLFLLLGTKNISPILIYFILFNMIITFYFYIRIIKQLFLHNDNNIEKYSIAVNQKMVLSISIILILIMGFIPQIYNYIYKISLI